MNLGVLVVNELDFVSCSFCQDFQMLDHCVASQQAERETETWLEFWKLPIIVG
jgi:hypothetical protein